MKRVLILGGSHSELPLVEAAQRLMCFVGTLGLDRAGVSAKLSDVHYEHDYSNSEIVRRVFVEGRFDVLVAGCNDFAAFSVARVADHLRLWGYDSVAQTEELHLKDRFRNLCKRLNIPSPQFVEVPKGSTAWQGEVGLLKLPVLVKPVDLTGGKGISKCELGDEIDDALTKAFAASREGRVIVEEFVGGALRSACFFIYGGNPVLLTHADEFMYRDPFLVASALAPSSSTASRLSMLTANVRRLSRELDLPDGLLHLQYLATEIEDVFIEICRRPPGDLYICLPSEHPEDSIAERVVKNAIGLQSNPISLPVAMPNNLRICIMSDKGKLGETWRLVPELQEITFNLVRLKDVRSEVHSFAREKYGIAFAEHHDRQILLDFAQFHKDLVMFEPFSK